MPTPCDAIVNEPSPPISPPVPVWEGNVSDATTTSPVSGATVRQFQCQGSSTPTEIDDTTTDTNGDYSFSGGDFDSGHYYYAQCDMTGPLSGMSVASGSMNPTAALPVGPSQSGVDFVFE